MKLRTSERFKDRGIYNDTMERKNCEKKSAVDNTGVDTA